MKGTITAAQAAKLIEAAGANLDKLGTEDYQLSVGLSTARVLVPITKDRVEAILTTLKTLAESLPQEGQVNIQIDVAPNDARVLEYMNAVQQQVLSGEEAQKA